MSSSLGLELKARREAAGLTQKEVAERLGVARPTLAQWEGDKHRPKPDHLSKLDDLYGARGELISLARNEPPSAGAVRPGRPRFVADIFRDVADALVAALIVDDTGRPLGWKRNLSERTAPPTALSTAFVVRTLQLLDEARVDLHSMADFFERRASPAGWSYSTGASERPEVTAILLAALSRLGRLTNVDEALVQLDNSIDRLAESRPYILAVVLESVLAIRPDSPLASRLVRNLLETRIPYGDHLLWTMDASADPGLVLPSQAHTARATSVLRLARPTHDQAEIDEAIAMSVEWMMSIQKADDSTIEILPPAPNDHAVGVPIHHFTAAWTIRAMAGVEGVPAPRLQAALDVVWESYSPSAGLWVWRADGTLPSWMTLDAVSALRLMAEVSLLTPISASDDGDNS